ncbi:MAG: hypothetical protein RI960_987, partial [Pseudomonadota bacterium]
HLNECAGWALIITIALIKQITNLKILKRHMYYKKSGPLAGLYRSDASQIAECGQLMFELRGMME